LVERYDAYEDMLYPTDLPSIAVYATIGIDRG
jgi:hypothetical protein